jgi:hypothetical protein
MFGSQRHSRMNDFVPGGIGPCAEINRGAAAHAGWGSAERVRKPSVEHRGTGKRARAVRAGQVRGDGYRVAESDDIDPRRPRSKHGIKMS